MAFTGLAGKYLFGFGNDKPKRDPNTTYSPPSLISAASREPTPSLINRPSGGTLV